MIYELFVADFSGTSDHREGPSQTSSLTGCPAATLGINCIELMPVKSLPRGDGWGYDLRSLFAVASGTAPAADVCRLVEANAMAAGFAC